jgi:type VI protein secretion system component VasK
MNPRARRIRRQRRQERDRIATSGKTMVQVQLDVMAEMIADASQNIDRILVDFARGASVITAEQMRAALNKRWRAAVRRVG